MTANLGDKLAIAISYEIKQFLHSLGPPLMSESEPGWIWWPALLKAYSSREGTPLEFRIRKVMPGNEAIVGVDQWSDYKVVAMARITVNDLRKSASSNCITFKDRRRWEPPTDTQDGSSGGGFIAALMAPLRVPTTALFSSSSSILLTQKQYSIFKTTLSSLRRHHEPSSPRCRRSLRPRGAIAEVQILFCNSTMSSSENQLLALVEEGFIEPLNGFTDEGWSTIGNDGVDDVTIPVNSSPDKLMGLMQFYVPKLQCCYRSGCFAISLVFR
ncbi:hypothetical protein AHAS_Ahas01G0320900 [Arachis hypogaea]